MAKHTLFLVHGMGRFEGTEWSDKVWDKLVECSQHYPHFREKRSLDGSAEHVPVGYDEFIRAALGRWNEELKTFGEFAQANEPVDGDSLDWLGGVSGDGPGFLLSHIADVIIYRFFKLESGQIRANVQLKIFEEIERKRKQDKEAQFSLMAHSLGTSVAHDALAAMGTSSEIDGHTNTFSADGNCHFESIHMLANVSRLLQTESKVYESVVRPGWKSGSKTRYCRRMYCHRHELDPFTKPKPFEPVSWSGFLLTSLRHYRAWDVHGWLHYLDHPRVHIPLLRSITVPTAISSTQTCEAEDDYAQFGDDLKNLAVAKGKIAELHALLQSIDEEQGLKENFDALCKVWDGVKELKALVGETWTSLEGSVT